VVTKAKHVGLEWDLHPDRRPRDARGTVVNLVPSAAIAGRAEIPSFAVPEHHRAELPATGQSTRKPPRSIWGAPAGLYHVKTPAADASAGGLNLGCGAASEGVVYCSTLVAAR
jgi:hypothetical protein